MFMHMNAHVKPLSGPLIDVLWTSIGPVMMIFDHHNPFHAWVITHQSKGFRSSKLNIVQTSETLFFLGESTI